MVLLGDLLKRGSSLSIVSDLFLRTVQQAMNDVCSCAYLTLFS